MTATVNGRPLADRIELADTPVKRFFGLMGRRSLRAGQGMLLVRCCAVHSFFMRMPIDAVSLSKGMRVVGVETLRPWRMGCLFRGARNVLELPEGAAVGFRVGDSLRFRKDGKPYGA